jgi:hypothetical protein
MKKLFLAILTLASAGAMAQPSQPTQQQQQQQREQAASQQPMDIYSFCYIENRAYSEGFQLNNTVCARSNSGPTKSVNTGGGSYVHVYPLIWKEKGGFYK